MAANIDEALRSVVTDVSAASTGGTVLPRMQDWIDQMFVDPSQFPPPGMPWNKDNEEQRAVYDWVVPSVYANDEMQMTGENTLAANIAIIVVRKTLLAVKFSTIASRILQAQEDSVVAIYTNVWE